MSICVVERKNDPTAFMPRGANRAAWSSRAFEQVLSGPAETGKTWTYLTKCHALLLKYPGAQGVLFRKTYNSLVGSALRTYQRIIGDDSGVEVYGGEKPQWYDYENGSRLWITGLDNPGKALSSERDFFCGNQLEECTLNDWETLSTRCTGRGAVMPYTLMMADANPGPPTHWIKQRADAGKITLFESRHEDNPTLYTDDGQITEQGTKTLSILDNLTGVRLLRLRRGLWASAEGAVYEEFDPAKHVIDARPIPAEWRRFRSIDFGYTNPFVCQWWAVDPDGNAYLYREIYYTKRLVEDHAKQIIALSADERFEDTVADHDAEDRATLERHGVRTTAAHKAVTPGIEAVASRLKPAGNGKPRLYIMRGALVERDPSLVERRLPTCTEQEIGEYSYPVAADGKPVKEEPLKIDDHGSDTARYFVARLDGLGPRITLSRKPLGASLIRN